MKERRAEGSLPVPGPAPRALAHRTNARPRPQITTMDAPSQQRQSNSLQRHLSNLKLVSRLLGHELHSQTNAKSITLSRDAVTEIQNTIDLYIEESSRGQGGPAGQAVASTRMVGNSTN